MRASLPSALAHIILTLYNGLISALPLPLSAGRLETKKPGSVWTKRTNRGDAIPNRGDQGLRKAATSMTTFPGGDLGRLIRGACLDSKSRKMQVGGGVALRGKSTHRRN